MDRVGDILAKPAALPAKTTGKARVASVAASGAAGSKAPHLMMVSVPAHSLPIASDTAPIKNHLNCAFSTPSRNVMRAWCRICACRRTSIVLDCLWITSIFVTRQEQTLLLAYLIVSGYINL
jgi:hypothetical protein